MRRHGGLFGEAVRVAAAADARLPAQEAAHGRVERAARSVLGRRRPLDQILANLSLGRDGAAAYSLAAVVDEPGPPLARHAVQHRVVDVENILAGETQRLRVAVLPVELGPHIEAVAGLFGHAAVPFQVELNLQRDIFQGPAELVGRRFGRRLAQVDAVELEHTVAAAQSGLHNHPTSPVMKPKNRKFQIDIREIHSDLRKLFYEFAGSPLPSV